MQDQERKTIQYRSVSQIPIVYYLWLISDLFQFSIFFSKNKNYRQGHKNHHRIQLPPPIIDDAHDSQTFD